MRHTALTLGLAATLALTLPIACRAQKLGDAANQYRAQYYGGLDGPYGEPDDAGYRHGPYDPPSYRRRSGQNYGNGRSISYQGFRISDPGDPEQLAAIEHQIDVVANVGLSSSNLQMFRRQQIRSGGQSHFDKAAVIMGDLQGKESRPVLLHELMHIYHRQHLPGGFNNANVLRFYNEAVAKGAYPAGSYVLKDKREFFAMTASAYLNGTIGRSPYNRETIAQQQPEYYAFLGTLFGPR